MQIKAVGVRLPNFCRIQGDFYRKQIRQRQDGHRQAMTKKYPKDSHHGDTQIKSDPGHFHRLSR